MRVPVPIAPRLRIKSPFVAGPSTEFHPRRIHAAAGDGFTDDTSAIVAAFSGVCAAGGGSIYLPAGVYIINPASARIPICSRLDVHGPGTVKVRAQAGNYQCIFAPNPPTAAVD